MAVLTGIAIWRPVQLAFLTDLMGGYVWARYWHFLSMVLLVLLSFIHIFMVFTVVPYSLRAIINRAYLREMLLFRGASRRTEEHETPPTAYKDDDRKLRIR